MTAAQPEPTPHPLGVGASPAVVKQWLLPHDAERFVGEYQAALDDARASLELGGVLEVVERWRGIAILQTDPDAYRRTIRHAAELVTGEPSPGDEPLEVHQQQGGLLVTCTWSSRSARMCKHRWRHFHPSCALRSPSYGPRSRSRRGRSARRSCRPTRPVANRWA